MKKLVYFESCPEVNSAIVREKLIKKWRREIKMEAIERINSEWGDLYYELLGDTKAFEDSKEKILQDSCLPVA